MLCGFKPGDKHTLYLEDQLFLTTNKKSCNQIMFTRSSHYGEFSKQVMNVINQWETDLQKTREAEEKLEVIANL